MGYELDWAEEKLIDIHFNLLLEGCRHPVHSWVGNLTRRAIGLASEAAYKNEAAPGRLAPLQSEPGNNHRA